MPTTESDARKALQRLVAALEAHLFAVEQRRGEHDPSVQAAFLDLRAAAADYDDVLYTEHDEVTPFDLPPLGADEDSDEEPDDDPARLSLLARWDFSVLDPGPLQAAAAEALGEEVDSNAVAVAALAHVRGHGGLARNAARVGLDWHGATTWVVGSEVEGDDTGWMNDAFADADPEALLCRFDVPVLREPEA